MLNITNLKYLYSNKKECYSYTLKVKKKEIVAITGESGSGKSTLFDLISGFFSSLEGTILLNEQRLEMLPIEKRPLSILFQNNNLFEHLSVEKNILLGKKGVQKEEVIEILREVGLEGYEKKIASTLSGGEQQRVGLARVLIRREPILLLDEPFSGLDEKKNEEMLALVKKITLKYELYTLMITHSLNDVEKIASKKYEMKDGQLLLC